ncbi:hypothetical protein OB2597_03212 [Pseudooceanicola batsensis HTCC2597]|uniref:Oxetanocin A resistance protein n=1 Tax=Pseudooceanicola batsensis (strain ATCC BAA-863 / DSM 15984 / KCTC 12145 / HTCC2597) TaxID=252305 RepID=A3TXN6_PSEBH|nr:hypothetical protein [Pseudooceanicola batsensis]EAQ03596.1 hypothetical protein OB2597_03212 [Pseudooceanicola batsensis HTCC2597]
MIPSLEEDCSRCAALCCLSLAFDRGEDFAFDKPAGTPCPNLRGHACGIHDRLRPEGFAGCVRYSCGGAGQRVVQEIFAGQSWRDDPALVAPMMEAFRGMRAVQDCLALLSAAAGLPLEHRDRETLDQLTATLMPEALDFDAVRFFPGSDREAEIGSFVKSLRRYVRR